MPRPAKTPPAFHQRAAQEFDLPGPLKVTPIKRQGNINLTFDIVSGTGGQKRQYLLQRLHTGVFKHPDRVVRSMAAALAAQDAALAAGLLPDGCEWELPNLVPTRAGGYLLEFEPDPEDKEAKPTYWRAMSFIPGCRQYRSLSELKGEAAALRIAEEAARGLGIWFEMTAAIDPRELKDPLPGYRNTPLIFDQLFSVLRGSRSPAEAAAFLPDDEELREATKHLFQVSLGARDYKHRIEDPTLQHYIDMARSLAGFGSSICKHLKDHHIRTVAIHGDTKLDNFLFSEATGKVHALIDLDTIMAHSWLVDWGDMARSLTNVAGEREPDLSKIDVNVPVFRALARGFFSVARQPSGFEIDLMVDAVRILALELGVRFLADYLRGDTYFRPDANDPPDINRTRAKVQLTLYEQLTARGEELTAIIKEEHEAAQAAR